MPGHHGLSQRSGLLHLTRKLFFAIGVIFAMVMLVVVYHEGKDARSAYCLASVTILLLTESLPTQVTAMMPLFLYLELDFFGDVNNFLPGSVLHVVALILMMASTDSTTLAAHIAFYMLSVTGTRLRNLQLTCLALSCFLSLLLEETLAVLLMARLIWKAVEVLQQESVQVLHQRELFRKTVTRMPALRARPELRESLLRSVEEASTDSSPSTVMDFSAPRATLSLLQTHEKPSTSFGQRASNKDIERLMSLPFSNDVSDQSAVTGHVKAQDKHTELSMPADTTPFSNEDSSSRPTTHYEKRRKEDIRTEGRVPRSPSSSVRSFSATPSGVVDAAISPGNAADEDSKAYDNEKSGLKPHTYRSVVLFLERQGVQRRQFFEPKVVRGHEGFSGNRLARRGGTECLSKSKAHPCRRSAKAPPRKAALCRRPPLTRGVALKSALLSPSRNRTRKTTTLLENGKIFYPGESSPPKKPDFGRKKKVTVAEEDRQEVREIYFWKKRVSSKESRGSFCEIPGDTRYHTIHKKLLLSVVVTCALTSIMNLTSNGGNLEFYLYFKRNFGEESTISTLSWWMLLLPMELLAFLLHWQFMWMTFLHHFDAPQSMATRVAIKLSIEKWRSDLGVARMAEYVPAVLIGIWLCIYIASVFGIILTTQSYEKLEVDFIVIVALFSLPWSWCGQPPTAGVRFVVERMPWGAVITYGSTFTLAFIVRSSRFATWLRDHLIGLQAHSKVLSQASLTVCAAFMTELLSSRNTVRILLPVATEAALLLYGVLLKALIVISVLISVDTLGHQAYNWSALPAWMLTHHLNASGEWFASSRQSRTTPYRPQYGAAHL
ncbi:hypothetical protein MTO96_049669 [Rhipicephalus appendiculatus]